MPARNLLLATALLFTLAACGSNSSIRESLGLNRKAPDEFRVYARPALTVPPEFNLRAPGSATDAPTAARADTQARAAIIGDVSEPEPTATKTKKGKKAVAVNNGPSNADAQFLQNAGVYKNKSDVRSAIAQEAENGVTPQNTSYFINPASRDEPTVDAQKEADRLKANKAQNKSPTDGETPVIEPKSKGILGTIGDIF